MNSLTLSYLGDSEAGGMFTPVSLLTCFDFPNDDSILSASSQEDIKAQRVRWHEYQHFLQTTTTIYGLNNFLWDFDRVLITYQCIQELANVADKIRFPLLKWRENTKDDRICQIVDEYFLHLKKRQETVGVMMGDNCDIDASKDIYYKRELVESVYKSCPFVRDSRHQKRTISLGARAVMEGAALLVEFLYLQRRLDLTTESATKEIIKSELESWGKLAPAPCYYITLDLTRDLGSWVTLALSDIALSPPVEIDELAHPLDRSPGHRFLECVEVARSLPQPSEMENFHSWYKEYVSEICHILRWQTPWSAVSNTVLDFLTDKMPFKPLNTLGFATTLLRGLSLKRKSPSFCANPVPDPEHSIFVSEGSISMIELLDINFLLDAVHPPPFVSINGKRVAYLEEKSHLRLEQISNSLDLKLNTDLANELKKLAQGSTNIWAPVQSSFEEYYIGSRFIKLIWHGGNEQCLRFENITRQTCNRKVGSKSFHTSTDCMCKSVLEGFLPCSLDQIEWM